jgi:16S rRNA (adenine1518-N6/adenine1519-N6)-dimethyltransferase
MEKSFKNIYRPAELFAFLESLGISPKRSLSQNFLLDRNILEKIIKTAGVQKGDLVLEIGPGPGSLTEILLEKGAKVLAVERDDTLANRG